MPDNTTDQTNRAWENLLPVTGKRKSALGLFVLLQLYFACNIFSFGFWKSGPSVFEYMILFYSTWLVVLILLLILFLGLSARSGLRQIDTVLFVIFSLPLCFGLWLKTLNIRPDIFFWNAVWIIPLLLIYYRLGVLYMGRVSAFMVTLGVLSFTGHSGIFAETGHMEEQEQPVAGEISLDRKRSIHVIMFDSLTHSNYSKTYLGVGNPAADYLSNLDDTIYAGDKGFAEYVPTRKSWAGLFELEKGDRNYNAFSGHAPSFLTELLRNNGYYIQTGFVGSYFGASQGEYVDRYVFDVADLEQSLVCADQEPLFGFCSELSRTIYQDWFRKRFKRTQKLEWPNVVISLIEQAEQKMPGPVFSAFHIYSPVGHTSGNYVTGNPAMFAKYKERFINQTRRARELLGDINRLRLRYPDAVFIISGDHGPWLSRTEKQDRQFIVLDRHAIALALLNASNLCPWSEDWLEEQKYLTPGRMLAASLACDGESRALTEHFQDNDEFVNFGESLVELNYGVSD